VFVPPRYSETQARAAIAASLTWSEALRKLGMRPAGGNWKTLQRYAQDVWRISTDHFDQNAKRRTRYRAQPLEEILVAGSPYNRGSLRRRLYAEGLKERRCELCGQTEVWRGRHMALILDHINGVAMDNRLDNLRIVCRSARQRSTRTAGATSHTRWSRSTAVAAASASSAAGLGSGTAQGTAARGMSA